MWPYRISPRRVFHGVAEDCTNTEQCVCVCGIHLGALGIVQYRFFLRDRVGSSTDRRLDMKKKTAGVKRNSARAFLLKCAK